MGWCVIGVGRDGRVGCVAVGVGVRVGWGGWS